jgi:hypothetical protein
MARRKSNQKDYLEISAVQMLSAAAIVLVSFILPAGALQYYQTRQAPESVPYVATANTNTPTVNANGGSVAGLSTSIPSNWFSLNLNLDLESEKGMLTVAGIFLIITGISLVTFLAITPRRNNKLYHEFNSDVSDFEREVVAKWN